MALAFLGIAAALSAPWWIWAIWVPAAAALTWHAWLAPPAGTVIDDETLTFHSGKRTVGVALRDISKVRVTEWSDGPDSYRIILGSGEEVSPPLRAQPPGRALAEELRRRGIVVEGP